MSAEHDTMSDPDGNTFSMKRRMIMRIVFFIFIVAFFTLIALVVVLLSLNDSGRTVRDLATKETAFAPEEKADKLVLMNLLNSFSLSADEAPLSPESDEAAHRREQIAIFLAKLKAVDATGPVLAAQEDLISLFTDWDALLMNRSDAAVLRSEFVRLGNKHSWLNALLWLVMLNYL